MDSDTTKLLLDLNWSLEELSEVTHNYTRVYGFAFSLLGDLRGSEERKVQHVYNKFPWRGGYSTVHFFNNLFKGIPENGKPEIEEIKYASPGYIELAVILEAAIHVGVMVAAVAVVYHTAFETYKNLHSRSSQMKLSDVDATDERGMTAAQAGFVKNASERMEQILGLSEQQRCVLDARVDGNKLMKMKILFSVFRRVEPLAEKQAQRKLKVQTTQDQVLPSDE
ncbi:MULTISPECIES: hypothetical protein [unclassified Pseudomonas]|jgi:hypothetical protein|uniref:hypothetical protein n=1 Tax=unclassified Pseudomonas TaxID=196821 RepID=UPI001F5697F7|nr:MULTISPECIES: hypothetical protein [unclassified Pseudomonas]